MTQIFDFTAADRISGTTFVSHFSTISGNIPSAKVATAARQATQVYLLPKVGAELYEHIATKNNPNANESQVLEHWRDAVAHYTVYHLASTGVATLSELGLRVYQDSDNAAQGVAPWQHFAATYNLVRSADAFVELSLQYIEDHKSSFHSYYTAAVGEVLVNSPADFASILGVERSVLLFQACGNAMQRSGKRLIEPILRDNYATILAAITGGNTASLSDEQVEAWRLARDVVAPAALLAAMPRLNLDLSNGKLEAVSIPDGLQRRRQATEESIAGLKAQLEREMEQARDLLIAYVAENASALGIELAAVNASRVIDTGKTVFIRRK